ncbi:MAG: ABC transporter ATP-binding protein [Actinobacteria bacterium]|nr:ABC transporter ATP-binding protein [Actinomycetota bacterium]
MLGHDGAPAGAGLRLAGLEKRFGKLAALRGVDLEVPWGAIVAVLGPNGAGKSTLLRILATTVLPDSGHAEVAGHDVVSDSAAARRALGLVLGDERSWYWRLTGRDNLEFYAALHGLRRPAARRRADELLAAVDLAHAADRRFDRYSSGMRARLALARALLHEPPVLCLDEPTATLDPVAAASFRALVRRQADTGRAVLFTTHDLHEAAAVASNVVVLAAGKVAAKVDDRPDAARLEAILIEAAGAASLEPR